jgi:putative ATP-binding cassette transporter
MLGNHTVTFRAGSSPRRPGLPGGVTSASPAQPTERRASGGRREAFTVGRIRSMCEIDDQFDFRDGKSDRFRASSASIPKYEPPTVGSRLRQRRAAVIDLRLQRPRLLGSSPPSEPAHVVTENFMSFGRRTILDEALCLIRPFWPMMTLSIVIGLLSGLTTAELLAMINSALDQPAGPSTREIVSFAAICLLSVLGGAGASAINCFVGQRIIAQLRKEVCAAILRAPISAIEERRPHRLLAILTDDIVSISTFTLNVSGCAVAFAVTVGSFIYLLSLSPGAFLLSAAAVAVGVSIHFRSKRHWMGDYENARNAQDDLQKHYRAITDGAKELRMNRPRRAHVHKLLLSCAIDRIADLTTSAMQRFWATEAMAGTIFFAVVGLLLVARGPFGLGSSVISGAILVLLYVRGPIGQLASVLPLFAQAKISFVRILALTRQDVEAELSIDDQRRVTPRAVRTIELRDACYAFTAAEPASGGFTLGPIDLEIMRGETLFIVGENGSGKTTLVKLLLGLYRPTSGMLLFNGAPVLAAELDDYRQHFSAIFSDSFLFDTILDAESEPGRSVADYLERLDIARQVRMDENRFSTIDLSTGQRKRLALIHAYLERRPILMLDEWAADQDPTFRRIFYDEILPELQADGRTLIVVSHDDRYFRAADRIIRLERGKIVEDRRLSGSRSGVREHACTLSARS